MKRIHIALIIIIQATFLASCGLHNDSESQKTPEQIRLEDISRMDTIELLMKVNPDTIEGRQKLDSLTADAWMLIDDSTGIVI